MKVSGNRPFGGPRDLEVRETGGQERSGSGGAAAAVRGDRVELSERARRLAEEVRATRSLPEVRVEKVQAARERIAAGTYAVDPEQLARRIIDEIV